MPLWALSMEGSSDAGTRTQRRERGAQVRWLGMAAERGEEHAMYNLGVMTPAMPDPELMFGVWTVGLLGFPYAGPTASGSAS